MKSTFIVKEFDLNLEKPENSKFVSYSQYSTFQKCQLQWKLKYIDKIKVDKPSIHAVFGTSMHNIVQHWIRVMYTETIKKADTLDFGALLLQELKQNYSADVQKYESHFSTKEELTEFYLDGVETLNYFRKKRKVYFDVKNQELVGTEVPLMYCPDNTKPNVMLIAYLDLVLKDKKGTKFYIRDFKTSTKGWNQWDKKDQGKIDQLLLYKVYFSKQYNIPIENIEVEFLILKRKIDPDSLYPQRRVQSFIPSQGNISYNRTLKNFGVFMDSCFLPNGEYNTLFNYKAVSGKNEFNCRFCEYKDRQDLCPTQNRILNV